MDVSGVCVALERCGSVERVVREEGEKYLEECKRCVGFEICLISLVRSREVCESVRMSGAIMLKNCVREWNECGDKSEFRESLYPALESLIVEGAAKVIYTQLLECVRLMLYTEDPWPSLIVSVDKAVSGRESLPHLRCALEVLRKLAYKYEISMSEREKLEAFIFPLLPKLLQIVTLANDMDNDDAMLLNKLICKIFHSLISLSLPQNELFLNCFDQYMQLLLFALSTEPQTMRTEAPGMLNRLADEQMETKPQHKCKKWAVESLYRFFSRIISSDQYSRTEKDKLVVDRFKHQWAAGSLQTVVTVLTDMCARPNRACETKRVVGKMLQIVTASVDNGELYKNIINPQIDIFLLHTIFPLLTYNDEDRENIQNNPLEYIRKTNESLTSVTDIREAASDLLIALARYRSKHVIDKIASIVQTKINNAQDPEIFGALNMLGKIAKRLGNKKRRNMIETFIMQHIPQLIKCNDSLVKTRALWCLEQFLMNKQMWKNSTNLILLFENVYASLFDADLTVRAQAAGCIKAFFEYSDFTDLQQLIVSKIQEIMKILFAILSEIDCELVTNTVEEMVNSYGEHTAPYALQILAFLSTSVLKSLSKGEASMNGDEQGEEEDEDISWSSLTSLQAIKTVLTVAKPEMYEHIFGILSPLIQKLASPTQIEYIDDWFDLFTYIALSHPTPLPATLFLSIQYMHIAVCGAGAQETLCLEFAQSTPGEDEVSPYKTGWCPDCLDGMLHPISNMLVKDGERTNPNEPNVAQPAICQKIATLPISAPLADNGVSLLQSTEGNVQPCFGDTLINRAVNVVAQNSYTHADLLLLMATKCVKDDIDVSSGVELVYLLFASYVNWQCLTDPQLVAALDLVVFVLVTRVEEAQPQQNSRQTNRVADIDNQQDSFAGKEKLDTADQKVLVRALLALFFYNPTKFLSYTEAKNRTKNIFDLIFQTLPFFKTIAEKKIFLLAFSKGLPCLATSQTVLDNILPHIIQQTKELVTLRKKEAEEFERENNASQNSDSSDDSEQDLDDNQDVHTNSKTQSILQNLMKAANVEDDSDDESFEMGEHGEFTLEPLETLNEFKFMTSVLTSLDNNLKSYLIKIVGVTDFQSFELHLKEAGELAVENA